MTRPYVLTRGAEADLRSIARYTVAQWGEQQCRTTIAELELQASALAQGEGVFKDMSTLLPGLRVAACGKHFIFRMSQPNGPAPILAILHERIDIVARLKSRLEY